MMKQPDYPVMIPYSELCELLDVAKQIKVYQTEVKRLNQQVLALRIMQQECFEKIGEMREELKSL